MKAVLSCAEMRAADAYTIKQCGVPSQTLMERAGRAIAEEAESLLNARGGRRVLAVCGGGNNGGDGWCAARILSLRGFETAVWPLAEPASPDCAAQRALYRGEVVGGIPPETDLIIDAIFGTGFRGAPAGVYADAVARINGSGAAVVAADIPSGLNGENGLCDLAVRADVTVAVGEIKRGHLLNDGPDYCGRLVRRDIGIELPAPPAASLLEASDVAPLFPPRRRNTHKGSFGEAAILAGSRAYSGAPLLSASAALRCGCGYTRLAVPDALFPPLVGRLPEAILTALPSRDGALCAEEGALRALCSAGGIAVGMGCGVSRGVYECVRFLLREYEGTLILDADALNSLAAFGTDALRGHRCRLLLTPHPKEFSRLCGEPVARVLQEGAALASRFAEEYGCTILLKGCTTIVADGKRLCFNAEGTPALAKGGSGDVLSGIAAALAARGAEPFDCACAASFLLGRAGRLAEKEIGCAESVTASDVAANLPRAIASLAGSGDIG